MTGLIEQLGASAREAAATLATLSGEARKHALDAMAAAIEQHGERILAANAFDLEQAEKRALNAAMIDRLRLDRARVCAIADAIARVAALADPVGRELAAWTRPNGLDIRRVAVPIGVIGVIYESRPNVTADAAALCLRAGNAVILRGGSEAVESNRAIYRALIAGLAAGPVPQTAVQIVPDQDRALVGEMLRASRHIDVVVPRGGRSLVERVRNDARVPVFAHLDGNNHLYVHAAAEHAMAIDVVVNAKMRRPGICGAVETVLIDRQRLDMVPALVEALTAAGCRIRGDSDIQACDQRVEPATDADWATEYLDAIIAMAVVDDLEAALNHITRFSSGHTDGIITADRAAAGQFIERVDSAIVMHNASTQFADGGEFGFGAEIGIATGRLHARGPVGPEQLTTFKYVVRGSGQSRPPA